MGGEKTNFINFTCKKMKDLADRPFAEFKKKFEEKCQQIKNENLSGEENSPSRIQDFQNKIKILNYYFNNLEEIFFNCTPEQGFFVLSPNDAHLVNIMYTSDMQKVYLFDHEYSCTNFLGFDIANYILESLFFLADHEYPFYTYHKKDLRTLTNENFMEVYVRFFGHFEEYSKDTSRRILSIKNFWN